MRSPACMVLVLVLATAVLRGAPLRAEDDGDGDQDSRLEAMQEAVEHGKIRPLSELKRIVETRYPGDIVHVSTLQVHGAFRYEFRVLRADGHLLEIEMDAASGKVLEVEND